MALSPVQAGETAEPLGKVVFILDGSGSMWGRIDEQAKIVTAKEQMIALIDELAGSMEMGLQVYGHRRKGDCDDIEMIAPLGSDRDLLVDSVQSIMPMGKTPITQSLKLTGDLLRTVEEETQVVLISDGEETCGADPCSMVRELRDQGIRLRVHVVGFDVNQDESAQLTCIADAGGGKYFSAGNAEQLKVALTEVSLEVRNPSPPPEPAPPVVVQAEPPPPPPAPAVAASQQISLVARTPGGQPVSGTFDWTIINADTEDMQVLDQQPGNVSVALVPGEYEIFLSSDELSGEGKIIVDAASPGEFTIEIAEAADALSISVPDEVVAGSVFEFSWRGPDVENDRLFVAPESMADNRYYDLDSRRVHAVANGSPGRLSAPTRAGTYEVRYYSHANGDVLMRTPLIVSEHQVALEVPASVAAGSILRLDWQGPAAADDRLFIASPDMGDSRYYSSGEHVHFTKEGSPAVLTAPAEPGNYEIRYYSFNNGDVLARFPLQVGPAGVQINTPESVPAGTLLSVEWQGPQREGDLLFIAEPDLATDRYYSSGGGVHAASEGSPASIVVPVSAGQYEIRYFSRSAGGTLKQVPITVLEPEVEIEAPRTATAGSVIAFSWHGPDLDGDMLFVAKPDAPQNQYPLGSAARHLTRDGQQGQLPVPTDRGNYEIRYFSKPNGQALARRVLIVR